MITKDTWRQQTEAIPAIKLTDHISSHPLHSIRRKVFIKWIFALAFTVPFIVLAVWTPYWWLKVLLSVVGLFYLFGDVYLYTVWHQLPKQLPTNQPLLPFLVEYRHLLKKVIRVEEVAGLIVYPFSAAAGFIIGMSYHIDAEEILVAKDLQIALLITVIILTPLSHVGTRWLNRKAFGDEMKRLDSLIENLNSR